MQCHPMPGGRPCQSPAAPRRDPALRPGATPAPRWQKQGARRTGAPMLAHSQDGAPAPEPEPRCGIFETYPQSGQNVTILDARDALETCGLLVGAGRDSCFAQFGCSAERTTKYYSAVQALESAFEREDEGDDDEYVPDKPDGDPQLPNPLGFVWRS